MKENILTSIVGLSGIVLGISLVLATVAWHLGVPIVTPDKPAPTVGVESPKTPNLMWAVLECRRGVEEMCKLSSNTMTALNEAGTPVRLCAVWGDKGQAQCLEVKSK